MSRPLIAICAAWLTAIVVAAIMQAFWPWEDE